MRLTATILILTGVFLAAMPSTWVRISGLVLIVWVFAWALCVSAGEADKKMEREYQKHFKD